MYLVLGIVFIIISIYLTAYIFENLIQDLKDLNNLIKKKKKKKKRRW
jgi:hypothetical protein